MSYFPSGEDQAFRICKVLADVFCAILLGTFSIVFFGWIGGIVAFVILEAALLGSTGSCQAQQTQQASFASRASDARQPTDGPPLAANKLGCYDSACPNARTFPLRRAPALTEKDIDQALRSAL
ncbi:hypothetical protein [Bradyrhizobium yuanmingense]|uniref:hypothetical protein n=1 Tax=Bradyrhizobium yuanmingense TaxID=108015 RepID=UPI001CD6C59B|nr:hypothetical protein [Bradyrhizobium yuanmingense]MCA1524099.1 hypothetical protein [Bradyrhizobium yuanmingense]